MKLIYICSPYAGDIEKNTKNAQKYCKFALDCGHAPIAVHLLYPQFLNENISEEREKGIAAGLHVLAKCSQLWIFGETISNGMQQEITRAKELGIPIRCVDVSSMKFKGGL